MTLSELESAQRTVQQRWYDLVQAEGDGLPEQALEDLFLAYLRAVEEYNRRLALQKSTQEHRYYIKSG